MLFAANPEWWVNNDIIYAKLLAVATAAHRVSKTGWFSQIVWAPTFFSSKYLIAIDIFFMRYVRLLGISVFYFKISLSAFEFFGLRYPLLQLSLWDIKYVSSKI